MKKSILVLAKSISLSKMHLHPELENFIHFSFIVQNNKIIEWGMNRRSIPPKHYGYNKRNTSDKNFVPKKHSEIDAYIKARDLLDKRKTFEMINVRLNKKGELRLSKPCFCCYELLKELGCKIFYYSDNSNFRFVR